MGLPERCSAVSEGDWARAMNRTEFRTELERLINATSMESGSNTPDFILADYLLMCLTAYDLAVNAREQWYGRITKEKS